MTIINITVRVVTAIITSPGATISIINRVMAITMETASIMVVPANITTRAAISIITSRTRRSSNREKMRIVR